jgi:signal transduction histidine kinase
MDENSLKLQIKTERGQAIVRLVTALLFLFYSIYLCFYSNIEFKTNMIFIGSSMFFVVFSVIILSSATIHKGIYPLRRVSTIIHDYSGICFFMYFGNEKTLILYPLILWATVGYGVRFGHVYLIIAACFAVAGVSLVFIFSEYWHSIPIVGATLLLSTIMVPTYLYTLLRERQTATDAIIAANQAKSMLLAQASHDLRQPIHAISLFTASLREEGLSATAKEMVESIDKSLHSVARLFRSLLDVSTLDSGKIAPCYEVISVDSLVSSIVSQNLKAAEWAGVRIRTIPSGKYVNGDPTLVSTMLQNLLSNAIKYAPRRPVLIGCTCHDNKLAIQVRDRGKGIAPQHLPHIYDEFYRALDKGHDIEGVGLGLAIVRRLANLMNLTVHIRPRSGTGSIASIDGFTIVPQPQSIQHYGGLLGRTSLRGVRVLLIDDDAAVLEATAGLLKRWGCLVQHATALPALIEPCDLLITDYDLNAAVSGADCIRVVRTRVSPRAKVIVITGHDAGRVHLDLEDKTIPIVQKPIGPAELRSVMEAMRLA